MGMTRRDSSDVTAPRDHGYVGTARRDSSDVAAPRDHGPVGMTSLGFAAAARSLGQAARLRGLIVCDFVSPPRRDDLNRSIRYRPAPARPVVAVRLRNRPPNAVLADMIEGCVVANRLKGARADLIRSALWLSVNCPESEHGVPESQDRGEQRVHANRVQVARTQVA